MCVVLTMLFILSKHFIVRMLTLPGRKQHTQTWEQIVLPLYLAPLSTVCSDIPASRKGSQ